MNRQPTTLVRFAPVWIPGFFTRRSEPSPESSGALITEMLAVLWLDALPTVITNVALLSVEMSLGTTTFTRNWPMAPGRE